MKEAGYFHGKQRMGIFAVDLYGVEFFLFGAVKFSPTADAKVVQDLEKPTAVFGFEEEQGSVWEVFPSFGRVQPQSEFGAVGLGVFAQTALEKGRVFPDLARVGKGGEAAGFVGRKRIVRENLFEKIGFGNAEFEDEGGVSFLEDSHNYH